jgi:succinate dehydrogenase/fumarate reductase flavoprotein subunit
MPKPVAVSSGYDADVVVVGSGCAGLTAALTAHRLGLKVLLIEKTNRIGGSTAVSGGAMWLPLSDNAGSSSDAGDSRERVWAYLQATVNAPSSEGMRKAFVDAAPAALRFMTRYTELRVVPRALAPDYYPDKPGAAQGGRVLDTMEFDGRKLGAHFNELREPIPEFLVLSGMMVNVADAKHLLAITRSFASWCHGTRLVLRYFADRLRGYSRGTRLLMGNALVARLFKSALDAGIPYWLNTAALALVRGMGTDAGRIVGVRVRKDGRESLLRVRCGVVIATGGFSRNDEMREQYYRSPSWPHSMAPEGNQGDGLRLAQSVGAALGTGHTDAAMWAPVSVMRRADGSSLLYPHLIWDRAKPGLVAVNSEGCRFVDEASSYHDFVRGMYRANRDSPSIPALLVCDADFMERWGMGLALPGGRPREHLIRAGYLFRAKTLKDLADQAGVNSAGLVQTVARFNRHAVNGKDPEFGKGGNAYDRHLGDASHQPNPCVAPVLRAPFYAVKVYPGDVGTVLGIHTDVHARALDAKGHVIDGLYVVGNDMHSIVAGEYPGAGIALGPALTFGWLAAMHLAQGLRLTPHSEENVT